MEVNLSGHIDGYRRKRDLISDGLADHYEFTRPGGAFYLFAKAPIPSGAQFVEKAIENGLLIIPGNIFSDHDTHFRISFAAPDETLRKGIDVLKQLAG